MQFAARTDEDPVHLWSSSRNFNEVKYAFQLCKDDKKRVLFEKPIVWPVTQLVLTMDQKPFVWSATQLVRFFRDPKMANLLTGPGS